MDGSSARRRRRRGSWFAVVTLALLAAPLHARAEWTRLPNTDLIAATAVGVLHTFRLLQVQDGTRRFVAVIDCPGRKILAVTTSDLGGEDLQNAEWLSIAPAGKAEPVWRHACARRPAAGGRWARVGAKIRGKFHAAQWSEVAGHREFRLTWVQMSVRQSEFWAVHCERRWIKPVAIRRTSVAVLEREWHAPRNDIDELFVAAVCR